MSQSSKAGIHIGYKTYKCKASLKVTSLKLACAGTKWFGVLTGPEIIKHEPLVQPVMSIQLRATNLPDAQKEADRYFASHMKRYNDIIDHGLPEGERLRGPDALGHTQRNADLVWRELVGLPRSRLEEQSSRALAQRHEAVAMTAQSIIDALMFVHESQGDPYIHSREPQQFNGWQECVQWAETEQKRRSDRDARIAEYEAEQARKEEAYLTAKEERLKSVRVRQAEAEEYVKECISSGKIKTASQLESKSTEAKLQARREWGDNFV